jgi:hypothetical protein
MVLRAVTTWVWLTRPVVDLAAGESGAEEGEETVWLHADPFRVLGLPVPSTVDEVRKARRRLSRLYHPDARPADPLSRARFEQIQNAARVVDQRREVVVEPAAGAWWEFLGFVRPQPTDEPSAVAGLRFGVTDRAQLPLSGRQDRVRIGYAGEVVELVVSYAPERVPAALVVARATALAETCLLAAVSAVLFAVVAAALALDVYLLSNLSVALTWAAGIGTLVLGYAGLVVALAPTGRQLPYPRRAVLRAHAALVRRRALSHTTN